MKTRVKFLCVSLLLALALACMFLSAAGTIRAYQQFEQNHQRIISGDVSTVSSWMTIPYVARVYHVPETCLYHSLGVSNSWLMRHATLRVVADHYGRPVNVFIRDVQHVILNYRNHRVICTSPPPPTPTASLISLRSLHFVTRKGECL